MGISSFAQQIGGNLTPLLYSVHTYSIAMGDIGYTANWGLYPSGTTAGDIEDGSAAAVALVPGTDYTVIPLLPAQQIVGGRSYWKIQFNLNIAQNTTYVIGYKETTADVNQCLTAAIQEIIVQETFDVDIALSTPAVDAARCGDESNNLLTGDETMQSSIDYRVFINYPDDPSYVLSGGNGYWRFDFNITVTGRGSAPNKDAVIATITANGTDGTNLINSTWSPNASIFDSNLDVTPVSIDPIIFTVTYNEVLGVTQDITFSISAIRGAYLEPDIDEVNNRPDLNRVTHTIYAMPNVGEITAWN